MEHRQRIWLADEPGVEIEEMVEAALGLWEVDVAGHDEVGCVVVALALDEAGVEIGKCGVEVADGGGEDLEFLAGAALDEGADDKMVDDLMPAAFADGLHHAGNPWALACAGERDAALAEEAEDDFEVLEFLDGDRVKLGDARVELVVFLEVEGGGGGFSLEVGVVNEDGGEAGADFRKPVVGYFLAPKEHAGTVRRKKADAKAGHSLLISRLIAAISMTMIRWFLLFACLATTAVAQTTLPMSVCFKGEERFYKLVEKLKPHAENLRRTPIGERAAYIGRWFVGTPYKGFTLEIDDKVESPSCNLLGLDCWTFFETALAFARMAELPVEQWTPRSLLKYIEIDRYWGGECTGSYLSRLHYLEDWLHDNARRGLVQDLTRTFGGRGVPNSATEMTNNWKSYRYMRNSPSLRAGIARLESRLRRQPLIMIPKDKVRGIESQLRNGDVIGIVSRDGDAYGTSHVGFALRKGGVLRFMHASAPSGHGKVVIDSRLSDYLSKFRKHAGILVARPLK